MYRISQENHNLRFNSYLPFAFLMIEVCMIEKHTNITVSVSVYRLKFSLEIVGVNTFRVHSMRVKRLDF